MDAVEWVGTSEHDRMTSDVWRGFCKPMIPIPMLFGVCLIQIDANRGGFDFRRCEASVCIREAHALTILGKRNHPGHAVERGGPFLPTVGQKRLLPSLSPGFGFAIPHDEFDTALVHFYAGRIIRQ